MEISTVNKRLVLVLCLIVAIASLSRVFCVAKDQLIAPHDLAFESPNLCTIRIIEAPCSKLQGIFDRKEVCHF